MWKSLVNALIAFSHWQSYEAGNACFSPLVRPVRGVDLALEYRGGADAVQGV
jgi:hypothetical protein